ncbi:hypothetical protein [uncultured Deinococcus sp.]|uniref:hypothetical protein n=1 Tax=uncultured Deinococcus sp. TaxID=158789 RepID=UPI0025D5F8A4|nr:hypothetical protein [uncultured Deinococcus sp.]
MPRPKSLLLDLSEATGTNTVPLDVKTADGRVLHFLVPERTDHQRASMAAQMQRCATDDEARELAAEWLLACAVGPVTREDAAGIVQRDTALAQVLTVLLSGRLPDPKVMDRLMTATLDRLVGDLILDIKTTAMTTPSSPRSSPVPVPPST